MKGRKGDATILTRMGIKHTLIEASVNVRKQHIRKIQPFSFHPQLVKRGLNPEIALAVQITDFMLNEKTQNKWEYINWGRFFEEYKPERIWAMVEYGLVWALRYTAAWH